MNHYTSHACNPRNNIQTPPAVVKKMCNMTNGHISNIYNRILEPGCGSGNFLVEILYRRLASIGNDPEKALISLSTIYGIDISEENITTARSQLHDMLEEHFPQAQTPDYRFWPSVDLFLRSNIICADLLGDLSQVYIVDWTYSGDLEFHGESVALQQLMLASRKDNC